MLIFTISVIFRFLSIEFILEVLGIHYDVMRMTSSLLFQVTSRDLPTEHHWFPQAYVIPTPSITRVAGRLLGLTISESCVCAQGKNSSVLGREMKLLLLLAIAATVSSRFLPVTQRRDRHLAFV